MEGPGATPPHFLRNTHHTTTKTRQNRSRRNASLAATTAGFHLHLQNSYTQLFQLNPPSRRALEDTLSSNR